MRKVFPLRNLTMPIPSSCISKSFPFPFGLKTKLPASINADPLSWLINADVSVKTDEIPVDLIAWLPLWQQTMLLLFRVESLPCLKPDTLTTLLDAMEMEELREKASIAAEGKLVKKDAG